MRRNVHEARVVGKAREIASTGRHNGWFHIACELSAHGEPLTLQILEREPYRTELDRKCAEVRKRMWGPGGPR